jgi:hypothetical protein
VSATLLLFPLLAALSLAGAYRVADDQHRQTLRYVAVTALWVASIAVIISISRS